MIIGFTTSYKHKTKYWVVVRVNSRHDTKCGVGLLFIQNKLPQKNLDFQNIKKAILGHSGKNFSVIKTLKGIFYNNSLISFCKNFFFFRLGLQDFFFRAFWLARIFFWYFTHPHPPPHHFSNGPFLNRPELRVLLSLNQQYPGTTCLLAIIKKSHHLMSWYLKE